MGVVKKKDNKYSVCRNENVKVTQNKLGIMKRIRNIFNIIYDLVVKIFTFHYTPEGRRDIGCLKSDGILKPKLDDFLCAEVKMMILYYRTAGYEM
jgi:hypothetical protein